MRAIPLLFLLAGCGLTTEGPFPSLQQRPGESARILAAPAAAMLSAEERAILAADLARTETALRNAETTLEAAQSELSTALKAASGAPVGSEAWSVAQLKLSRFESARGPLGDIASRLGPSRLMVDSLPQADPDRQKLATLDQQADALLKRAAATADRANRALKPL